MKSVVISATCLILISLASHVGGKQVEVDDAIIQKLFQAISDTLAKEEVPYIPGVQWARRKGSYHTELKLNIHGQCWETHIRRDTGIDDNNVFVTELVAGVLLEAYWYEASPAPTEEQLVSSVEFVGKALDKNSDYSPTVVSFWPVELLSEDGAFWQYPENLLKFSESLKDLPFPQLRDALNILGIGQDLNSLQYLMDAAKVDGQFFLRMPPDNDDIFVWVIFGSLLYQMKDDFPAAWEAWDKLNPNLTSVVDNLKTYTYRPFSGDPVMDTVDPFSYFGVRHFLDEAKASGKDVVLPTIFLANTDQSINNDEFVTRYLTVQLDMVVAANVLYGITTSVLSGLITPDILTEDLDVIKIYHNTSTAIVFAIKNNFKDFYAEISFLYLHKLFFSWAVSRTVSLIDTHKSTKALPAPIMEEVYNELVDVLQVEITEYILEQAKMDEDGSVYLDDFLGNDDRSFDNQPVNYAEDRIFVTASAVNTLMNTWLARDDAGKSTWKLGTPEDVKKIVDGGVQWLVKHSLDGQYQPWNVLFTGGIVGPDYDSFVYPANRYETVDGSPIEDISKLSPMEIFLLGVQGYVEPEEYEKMLKEKHFGFNTPTSFGSFNVPGVAYPIWCSDSVTYASALLAVARYRNIVQ